MVQSFISSYWHHMYMMPGISPLEAIATVVAIAFFVTLYRVSKRNQ